MKLYCTVDLTNSAAEPSSLTLLSSGTSSGTNIPNVDDGIPAESTHELPVSDVPSSNPTQLKCLIDIQSIINTAKRLNLIHPIEVIRFLQQEIVSGRMLDVASHEETIDGDANCITVDRDNIMETTFSEFQFIDDFTKTFQVDFMGEESVDLGGPRKEWIRLMNQAIKEKYFDNGLRSFLANDYFHVGIMIAIAMLQNGQMPAFLGEDILEEVISITKSPTRNPCITELCRGLQVLGILSALQQLPMLVHVLRPNAQKKVNVQNLLQILKPKFSEEGSNAQKQEKETYHKFVTYVREVGGGRRSCGQKRIVLDNILEFVTGASEEPVLGFCMAPSIHFILPFETKVANSSEKEESVVVPGFVPLAHTCGNLLELPRATNQFPLPTQERLFALYDLAFSQSYFGKD